MHAVLADQEASDRAERQRRQQEIQRQAEMELRALQEEEEEARRRQAEEEERRRKEDEEAELQARVIFCAVLSNAICPPRLCV